MSKEEETRKEATFNGGDQTEPQPRDGTSSTLMDKIRPEPRVSTRRLACKSASLSTSDPR
jgi:hypothetical protein